MEQNEFKITTDRSYRPGAAAEKDEVQFGYYAVGADIPELILYRKGTEEIAAVLPFPKECGVGGFYSMKVRMRASSYEYNFREGEKVVVDPYAKKIVGRGEFGSMPSGSEHEIRGGFVTGRYDWEDDRRPQIPYSEAVMYHLHVRGFTKQKNSGVRKKGTFAGVREKLPYLKELGINQLKLMPSYDFPEMVLQIPTDGMPKAQKEAMAKQAGVANPQDVYRMNYWGYGPGHYFAVKESYAAGKDAETEFKDLVKEAHRLGIEVLMEFCFADDTDVLLMGECLNYWAEEYHIDGFSVIVRDGLAAELARLPLFRRVKLICNWFPDLICRENAGKWFGKAVQGTTVQIAESNDGFMNDCRKLLKGDEESLGDFIYRLHRNPRGCTVVNYMTNHDGFTLADLVSYDRKYNQDNGEHERDGTDYNYSWNCGMEGQTRKKEVLRLRMRQRKNALTMLLFAQGTPMLLAGDEFGNSQSGNNNPYCHDSELTWLDWNRSKSNRELTDFVQQAIAYRKAHKTLHQERELKCMDSQADGFPDLSYHGERAWYCELDRVNRHVGCMYSGKYAGENGFIYVAYNLYWMEQEFALPLLPKNMSWYKVMDTVQEQSFLEIPEEIGRVKTFRVPARTIMILEGRENDTVKVKEDKDRRPSEPDHLAESEGTSENDHGAQAAGDAALLPGRTV